MAFLGIHHLSALTTNAQKNVEFYTQVLGLRLVKKTVNQDDPSVYHLFYGDEKGSPGTELTFFEIPMLAKTREGGNSISAVSLRVPTDQSLTYWKERLDAHQVEREEIVQRAGRATLAFRDPEGQRLVLVSDEQNRGVPGGEPWAKSPVPSEHGIRGLGPVKLAVPRRGPTEQVLTEVMGLRLSGSYPSDVPGQPDILVYEMGEGGTGAEVHLEERTDLPRERPGRGSVHHVAFRVATEEELRAWIPRLTEAGLANSGFVDRFYFRSLYFREPNGILFELATDGPGFDTDESLERLGETLALPPFLEGKREQIEAHLKPLHLNPPPHRP
ncbi:putative ring-cleaving dioxygenase MhqA [Paenibacillus sp. J31TS4]|uniref:ring-cleaving dioxygenase n=1 Tax=Paenibacillus sp. J31TS4 TaxID=2807195 RepID=UPI001B0FD0D8|nr:ring-cleaving dioxygenase [Paenibacillus sp. J31TS4]GIP38701.1 putative ring-cleaving dioxygenase MhqA [Paenibacillus sp. J31TS4]